MHTTTSAFCIALIALLPSPVEPTGAPSGTLLAPPKLLEITELRQRTVAKRDDNVTYFGESPGLDLEFQLALPDGTQLLEVAQPEEIVAQDSTGTDLTAIEPNFSDELEYVETGMSFEGDPAEFTLHLALPARTAQTFTVKTAFDAVVYTGTAERNVELGDAWTDLDPEAFSGHTLKARFGESDGFFGESFGIEMTPVTGREVIESVSAVIDGETFESSGSMWDDRTVTFLLDGEFPEGATRATVTFTVRTGLQRLPITIELKDVELP